MRNIILAGLIILSTVLGVLPDAHAEVSAEGIFANIGGTTTIDKGGALHSQARSIYSLGGGMTSFQGKRVSLMSADPPSFSAGCTGISWHFGGFSFISADEIRQLVEAVAQASLGVAVDLAMQTLCPQCYAVMSKLREISNMMRNAAADACKTAEHLGALISDKLPGKYQPNKAMEQCSGYTAEKMKADNSLSTQMGGGLCQGLNAIQNTMKDAGKAVSDWMGTGTTADGKTPSKSLVDESGNMTYEALGALGYADGFVKDVLLSYMGMVVVAAEPAPDCTQAFNSIFGSAESDALAADMNGTATVTDQAVLDKINNIYAANAERVVAASQDAAVRTSDAVITQAAPDPTGSKLSKPTCFAPPLLTGVQAMGTQILCGFYPQADMLRFQNKFGASAWAAKQFSESALGTLCNTKAMGAGLLKNVVASKDSTNPLMYHCEKASSKGCMVPGMRRMSDALGQSVPTGQYSGLAWMVLDALYSGIDAVQRGIPLPPTTIAVLNGSGYPLYRLINLAAVYPGMADEILQAYGGVIAIHFTLDTIAKISAPGALPTVKLEHGKGNLSPTSLTEVRKEIMQLQHGHKEVLSEVLKRMGEKRALVATIVEVNKALQADVISQGLGGNTDLALSIKHQLNPTTTP